jgi:hypothetical protein
MWQVKSTTQTWQMPESILGLDEVGRVEARIEGLDPHCIKKLLDTLDARYDICMRKQHMRPR